MLTLDIEHVFDYNIVALDFLGVDFDTIVL
jgi:hypothetical protein